MSVHRNHTLTDTAAALLERTLGSLAHHTHGVVWAGGNAACPAASPGASGTLVVGGPDGGGIGVAGTSLVRNGVVRS